MGRPRPHSDEEGAKRRHRSQRHHHLSIRQDREGQTHHRQNIEAGLKDHRGQTNRPSSPMPVSKTRVNLAPHFQNQPEKENDELVQSWLAQTQQAHGVRRLTVQDENGRPGLPSPPLRSRENGKWGEKKTRPPSEDVSVPPKRVRPTGEHRFEKRARHKTREDKYDTNRGSLDQKRRVCKETQAQDIKRKREGARKGEREDLSRNERSSACSVLPLRARKAHASVDNTHDTKSKPRAVDSSPGHPSKPKKLRRSKVEEQREHNEDKELDELTAFFSRRRASSGKHNYAEEDIPRPRRAHILSNIAPRPDRRANITGRYEPVSRGVGTNRSSNPPSKGHIDRAHSTSKATTYFTWSKSGHDQEKQHIPVRSPLVATHQKQHARAVKPPLGRSTSPQSPEAPSPRRSTTRERHIPAEKKNYRDVGVQTQFSLRVDHDIQPKGGHYKGWRATVTDDRFASPMGEARHQLDPRGNLQQDIRHATMNSLPQPILGDTTRLPLVEQDFMERAPPVDLPRALSRPTMAAARYTPIPFHHGQWHSGPPHQ
ncbi:hypothetical protein B0T17DRAFT_511319 [Bombardia bombarda]|uniref:Uncharacterized protein n=1 Tax=Bombardia bombarda TaxID=252184 RepID=A0AA39WD40_9PEZI|nr:hypothetical protein B0T17DRAFT_511319 [Bombardia bombarda]